MASNKPSVAARVGVAQGVVGLQELREPAAQGDRPLLAFFEPDPVAFLQVNEIVGEVDPVGLALHDFLLPHAGEEAAAEDLLQAGVIAFVDELVPQFARAERLHWRRAQRYKFHVQNGAARKNPIPQFRTRPGRSKLATSDQVRFS